jgi:hypothetical protein
MFGKALFIKNRAFVFQVKYFLAAKISPSQCPDVPITKKERIYYVKIREFEDLPEVFDPGGFVRFSSLIFFRVPRIGITLLRPSVGSMHEHLQHLCGRLRYARSPSV